MSQSTILPLETHSTVSARVVHEVAGKFLNDGWKRNVLRMSDLHWIANWPG